MKPFITILLVALVHLAHAQLKKDGTPDMRFKANKQLYGNTSIFVPHNTPSSNRNYPNGGQLKLQDGYMKSNGTYVEPHLKTTPDNFKWNNLNYKER